MTPFYSLCILLHHFLSAKCFRVCGSGRRGNVLEHLQLLGQVVAEQAVEASQVRVSGKLQPHHLVQVPVKKRSPVFLGK